MQIQNVKKNMGNNPTTALFQSVNRGEKRAKIRDQSTDFLQIRGEKKKRSERPLPGR